MYAATPPEKKNYTPRCYAENGDQNRVSVKYGDHMIPGWGPRFGRMSRELSLVVTVVCLLLPVGVGRSCQDLFVRWWWLWYLLLC